MPAIKWQVSWSQSTPPPNTYTHVLEGSVSPERSFLDGVLKNIGLALVTWIMLAFPAVARIMRTS